MNISFHETGLLADFGLDRKIIASLFEKAAGLVFPEKNKKAQVSVIFVVPDYIQNLNKKFRRVDEPTDVMAFPLREKNSFGEIYICLAEAAENARDYREKIQREVVRLFVHGSLHLLGYRDDQKAKRDSMWQKQESVVKKVI